MFSLTPRFCLAIAILLASNAHAAAQANILLIIADDLGYGDLGCYGSKDIRTPQLDRLAKQGVRLTDAYANAPVCSPTRAALITGRYPQRAGFDWVVRYGDRTLGLPASKSSLPRLLKEAGYRTGLFGKWHLGYREEWGPNAHGFEEFFGFLAADLDFYSHKEANGEPGLYEDTRLVEKPGYLTDLITERAVGFIRKHAKERFFLEVAYNAPHWPFQPPNKPDDVRNSATYGPETGTRADYIQMVEHLDAGIGQVLEALNAHGLANDTLVIFFSDNGGERLSDNGPLFHGKYTLWEGGIRVPAIVRWPAVIPAGRVSAQPVITTDLTASILAAAQVPLPTSLDGEDVLPILAGKQPPRERTFFWRLPRPDNKFGQKAVRRGQWKYLYDREMELLFDLEKDIGERTNLAYRHPELVAELRKALAEWEKDLSQDKPPTPTEQYQALLKEYRLASSGGALNDEERMKLIARVYQRRNELALRFVELAEKHPQDPIAVDALIQAVWYVNSNPWPVEVAGVDRAMPRAFALLQRDHLRSEKLGPLCQRVSSGFCVEYETFLRAVVERNPHRDVQGIACLSLAHFLHNRAQRVDLIRDQPEQAGEFAGLVGKDYVDRLQRQDRKRVGEEVEALFDRTVKRHGDVKLPDGGTVGEKAGVELFEIRHLSVGKVAPDIEGEDQDGKRFKLSDYRGKVVLLDFWSYV